MSFRRQLVLMILAIVVFTIIINSLIVGQFVNRNFQKYIEDQYDTEVEYISEYARSILIGEVDDLKQINRELGKFLSDMITSIGIYDENNSLLVRLQQTGSTMHMMGSPEPEKDFIYPIVENSETIGYVLIKRIERFDRSAASRLFFGAVVRISFQAVAITLVLSLISIFFISKRMTRDLNGTAEMAEDIDGLENLNYKVSTTKEISAIQKKLIDQASKLRVKQKIQKEKADQLAHEARTPLTILKTSIEGVMDGVVELDQERLNLWIHEVDRLSTIVEDVGEILMLEESPVVSRRQIAIGDLIDKVIKSIRPQFSRKGIKLEFNGLDREMSLMTDPDLLSQSLYNLLMNALKFTPEGGRVEVSAEQIEDKMHLRISDNGIGLDEDELEQVFSAYYRGRNGQGVEGQGMGLDIVRRNITALGGAVGLTINQDKGVTATIQL